MLHLVEFPQQGHPVTQVVDRVETEVNGQNQIECIQKGGNSPAASSQ
jgi:hypothetical protein